MGARAEPTDPRAVERAQRLGARAEPADPRAVERAQGLGARAEPADPRAVERAIFRAAEEALEPRLQMDGSRAAAHRRGVLAALGALPWMLPALVLLGVAVGWPLVDLVRISLGHYPGLWHEPAMGAVALRTGIWVVAVVPTTVVLSLALAQLFAVRFPLRRLTRTALILPLAASVTVTAVVFRWALDPRAGVINVVLHGLGLVRLGSTDASWLTRPGWAFAWMIAVAVFVSVPLTTYVLLVGLSRIPPALRDAARLDGPAPWRRLWSATLPTLRPALLAVALIDLVTAFNGLPIVWEMTRGGPSHRFDITSSFMFGLGASSPGQAAALGVADLVVVVAAVAVFLRVTRPRTEVWPAGGAWPGGGVWPGGAGSPRRRGSSERQPELPSRRLSRGRAAAASLGAGLVALVFLAPYLEMVVASLRPQDQLFAANLLPTHFTLTNFSAVWSAGVGHNLLRSLLIAGGATGLVMVSATAAALHGARQRVVRRPLVLVLTVAAQLLGPVALLQGLARASARVALPSTAALIVIEAAFNLGFAIWILERGFRSVPSALRDTAALDSLTPAGRFVRVKLLPNSGAVLAALVFTFVSAWDELSVALTLTGSGASRQRPLTVVINDQLNQASIQWGHVLAACVITALPAIVLLALIERRLVPGEAVPTPG